jgi:hypothetical protein
MVHDVHVISRERLLHPSAFPGFGFIRSLLKVLFAAFAAFRCQDILMNQAILRFQNVLQGLPLAVSLAIAIVIPSPSTGVCSPYCLCFISFEPHLKFIALAVAVFTGGCAPVLVFVMPQLCRAVRSTGGVSSGFHYFALVCALVISAGIIDCLCLIIISIIIIIICFC